MSSLAIRGAAIVIDPHRDTTITMGLLEPRSRYAPFEYPEAEDYWLRQNQTHWLHTECPLGTDVQDWKFKLTEAERQVIAGVLRGFTETEVLVAEYWSTHVTKWFKKPEIAAMAHTFSCLESIHQKSYHNLSATLGLDDYEAFKADPAAQAKLENLTKVTVDSPEEIARSLAIFSGFTEGVSLFSSFAILQWFSRPDQADPRLEGVGDIIEFSIRDESLHSEAGCWLFRTLVKEYPHLNTAELANDVYEAARTVVRIEHSFLDSVFSKGPIEGLDKEDLKAFIELRANSKLIDLGYQPIFEYDPEAADRINGWFSLLNGSKKHKDFFSGLPSDYARGAVEFDAESLWD